MSGRREGTLRASILHNLRDLHAIAVENPVLPGTPDVEVLGTWIELKSLEDWPKRAATVIPMDHFTPQQRVFHLRRTRAGGRSFVMIEVCLARDFLLLRGDVAARILGRTAGRSDLTTAATRFWHTKAEAMSGLREFVLSLPHGDVPTDHGSQAGS